MTKNKAKERKTEILKSLTGKRKQDIADELGVGYETITKYLLQFQRKGIKLIQTHESRNANLWSLGESLESALNKMDNPIQLQRREKPYNPLLKHNNAPWFIITHELQGLFLRQESQRPTGWVNGQGLSD